MITLIIVYIKKSAVRPEIPLTATTSNKTSSNTRETEKSLNVITYNFGMFIFVFILPFGITIYANLRSLLIVIFLIYLFIN